MSLTPEQNHWHEQYRNSSDTIQRAIDVAFDAARTELHSRHYDTANDDRAEALIAALMQYFCDSAT